MADRRIIPGTLQELDELATQVEIARARLIVRMEPVIGRARAGDTEAMNAAFRAIPLCRGILDSYWDI